MTLDSFLGLLFFLLIFFAIIVFIERIVVPRIPQDTKVKLTNYIVIRIVVLCSIIGLLMLKIPLFSIIAILLGFVYLMAIRDGLKKEKELSDNTKNTLNTAILPINSNEIKEQEAVEPVANNMVVNNKLEMKNNAPNNLEVEGKDNALENVVSKLTTNTYNNNKQKYNSELALGESLYLPNNELQKQNRAKVSREELEGRFAIYLEGSEQFKHNNTSYARNDSKYVTGELLECGLPNDTDKCVSVQQMKQQELKEGFANLPRRYFNDKPCSCGPECRATGKCNCGCPACDGSFTTRAQLKDAQSNLVGCGCDNKKDIQVTCLNKETNALYSAKRQYSSQGTSNNPMNPSGFNL